MKAKPVDKGDANADDYVDAEREGDVPQGMTKSSGKGEEPKGKGTGNESEVKAAAETASTLMV